MAQQLDLFDPFLIHSPSRGTAGGGKKRRNELLAVMELAMIVSRRLLDDYSCPKSKHTFTQPQLLACLLLRAYHKLSYRATTALLQASDQLRSVLGLEAVPAHTTLKVFADRVISPRLLDQALAQLLEMLGQQGLVIDEVALDSSGLSTSSASAYFLSRAKRVCASYVKISLAVACRSILAVGMCLSIGPSNDLTQAHELLWKATSRCAADWYFMDKGYDAEWPHTFIAAAGAKSFIPVICRSAAGLIKDGPHRRRCAVHVPYHYGRRWHIESFISGMKRTCGGTLAARSQTALLTEAGLKVLAYAIRR